MNNEPSSEHEDHANGEPGETPALASFSIGVAMWLLLPLSIWFDFIQSNLPAGLSTYVVHGVIGGACLVLCIAGVGLGFRALRQLQRAALLEALTVIGIMLNLLWPIFIGTTIAAGMAIDYMFLGSE